MGPRQRVTDRNSAYVSQGVSLGLAPLLVADVRFGSEWDVRFPARSSRSQC